MNCSLHLLIGLSVLSISVVCAQDPPPIQDKAFQLMQTAHRLTSAEMEMILGPERAEILSLVRRVARSEVNEFALSDLSRPRLSPREARWVLLRLPDTEVLEIIGNQLAEYQLISPYGTAVDGLFDDALRSRQPKLLPYIAKSIFRNEDTSTRDFEWDQPGKFNRGPVSTLPDPGAAKRVSPNDRPVKTTKSSNDSPISGLPEVAEGTAPRSLLWPLWSVLAAVLAAAGWLLLRAKRPGKKSLIPSLQDKMMQTSDPLNRWRLPSNAGVVSPGDATAEMDSRLSQAGVFARPKAPTDEVNGFGQRQSVFGNPDGTFTDDQLDVMNLMQREQFTTKTKDQNECIVIYVPWLATRQSYFDPKSGFLYISVKDWAVNPPARLTDPEDDKGALGRMYRAMAHEFGHFMKMSKRGDDDFGGDGSFHDDDPSPRGIAALMRGGEKGNPGRWIRHEDWEVASKRAKARGL